MENPGNKEMETTTTMESGQTRKKAEENDGSDKQTSMKDRRQGIFDKELTVVLEISGEELTAMNLIRAAKEVCGRLIGCRMITKDKYEVTVNNTQAKDRLLDGFRVGEVKVHGREITSDELVVSFMGLPVYIEDEEILEKLKAWGVSAVSGVRRRLWPGTDVADGTRFVKVRFSDTVQSLPYSARFITAAGPEYFRVIHDRQVRVCRGCLQPDHVYRDCPEFLCRKCGSQGHYARECVDFRGSRCGTCKNPKLTCVCRDSNPGEGTSGGESGGTAGRVTNNSPYDHLFDLLPISAGGEGNIIPPSVEAPVQERAREIGSHPTPSREGGAQKGPTPKATAAEVELGRGMISEPEPLSTPERGEAAPEEGRTPRPERSRSLVPEGNGEKEMELAENKGENASERDAAHRQQFQSLKEGKIKKRIAHSPKPTLLNPLQSDPAPKTAAEPTNVGDPEPDLMDFSTGEVKKRQNENGGGKKVTKKHK